MSIEIKTDHVYLHLVENAPFNKGKSKMYAGVPGNLVAFACRLSFQRGQEGMFPFSLNHNESNITRKRLVHFILVEES